MFVVLNGIYKVVIEKYFKKFFILRIYYIPLQCIYRGIYFSGNFAEFNFFIIMNSSKIETVNAQVFVQVINSDRATQVDKFGGWLSSKSSGRELVNKAKQRLDAYKGYVSFLEQVVELNPSDIDLQLNLSKITATLKNVSPELREQVMAEIKG